MEDCAVPKNMSLRRMSIVESAVTEIADQVIIAINEGNNKGSACYSV